ncbi:MAG: (Fe-S)-binding protein, partial [Acidobacteriota bacterium]
MRGTLTSIEGPLYEKTLSCVHCGLCLPACPAYESLGRESVAPRGQVYNIRAVLEGRLSLTKTLAKDIYDCLACRACESVCPAGVPVGSIMEDVRGLITRARSESRLSRSVKRFMLGGILCHPGRLSLVMELLRFYEWSGLRKVLRAVGVLSFLPGRLSEKETLLPSVPPRAERRPMPPVLPAEGKLRKRVALFTGCVASHLFPDVNRATARVLQRNGYEVAVPRRQTCCGALHLHNGLPEVARELAGRNVDAFLSVAADAVVVNAAGCGAALAEYGELLGPSESAARFAAQVVDISALLVREGYESPSGRLDALVAYDAPCHLYHGQGVREEPEQLLASIPGVRLVR